MLDMDIKKKKKALTIAVILFVVTAFLAVMMIIEFTNIGQFEVSKNAAINQTVNAEWDYINSKIQDNYAGAKDQAELIKKHIIKDINETYTDKDSLKKGLAACIEGNDSKLVSIIGSNIEGVYYDGIKNDANDPFVMTRNKILSDLSLNCSADKRTRDFNKEISMHFNKTLAKQALESIVMQDDKEVFWNFVEVNKEYPWYNDVKNMKTMDIDKLKTLFIKYKDIRIFESFEFISTAYIYEKEDMTGEAIVNYNGEFNEDANQLFVNSNFNILDVIKNNSNDSVVISGYTKDIEQIQKDFDSKRNYNYALMIIEGLAYLVTLIALATLQRFIINKK